jgi:hypothetical protein
VAAVDEKVLYCFARPPLPARSSSMEENSNISPKEVVHLVYELATD